MPTASGTADHLPCKPPIGVGSIRDLVHAILQDLRGCRHQSDSAQKPHASPSYIDKRVSNVLTDDVVAEPSEGALSETGPAVFQSFGSDFQSPVSQCLQILAYVQGRLSERPPVFGSHPEDTLQVPVHQKTDE